MRWWETYCTDQPAWPIAVTALDMLIATEDEWMGKAAVRTAHSIPFLSPFRYTSILFHTP